MGVLLPLQPASLQFIAYDTERAHTRIADVGEDQFFGAPGGHHLVIDQIRCRARQGKVFPPLADDLMPGGKWDHVGETGTVNRISIVHIPGDGILERTKFCHGLFRFIKLLLLHLGVNLLVHVQLQVVQASGILAA